MAIFDTSVLLSLFDPGHVHHAKAREATESHTLWHVTPGVLAELTQVVRRHANARGTDGSALSRRLLETLETTTSYRPLAQHDPEFVSRIFQIHAELSYVDAWGIAVALDRVEPLVTFDERQRAVWESLR
ncbi:MAG: PIN domain-containing protein [Euryarchaeota archaeon]|nr:PIN domain-containing protein [Euryarchaeota archaeon]